ncbi:MAG: hypothetical protein EOO75_18435, partial [Myxococcales bacterium]
MMSPTPFSDLTDFFPFAITSGPGFTLLYAALIAAGMGATTLMRRRIIAATELPLDDPSDDDAPVAQRGYRAGVPASGRRRLQIGWAPQPDEIPAIAYLRGGNDAVASTVLATAIAGGQLVNDNLDEKAVPAYRLTDEPSASPLVKHLVSRLRGESGSPLPATTLLEAATVFAASHELRLAGELSDAGFDRLASTRRRLMWPGLATGAVLLGIGAVRYLRALELDRNTGHLTFLMLGCTLLVLASLGSSSRSASADAYLAWLASMTGSLQGDLQAGRRRGADDVGLGVSVHGVTALVGAPILVGFFPLLGAASAG